MPRIVLVKVAPGMYAPLDAEDVTAIDDGEILVCDMKKGKSLLLTLMQIRSINLYLTWLSDALNDAGLDMQKVLERKSVSLPWTQTSAKEALWRPIQKALFDTDSTLKLTRIDVSRNYEVLNRHTSTLFGVGVQFPDKYMQIYEREAQSRANQQKG